MNISATFNSAVDVDATLTGTLTVDTTSATGSTTVDCKVAYTSTGGTYTSSPVAYDGSSTTTWAFTNGTSMTYNQATGAVTYNRLSTDYSDGSTDTYSFTFTLSDTATSQTATASVTTRKNLTISSFTADAANDVATSLSGTIAMAVLNDSGVTISASVSGKNFNEGTAKTYSNSTASYSWSFSDGGELTVNRSAGTWLYKRPTADVGDLKASLYTINVTLKDSYVSENGYVAVTTTVTYPPSVSSFTVDSVSDTSSAITGSLALNDASGSAVVMAVSKNGYIYTGASVTYAESMNWSFGDGSSFAWNSSTKAWTFTRSTDSVGDNKSDIYVFTVSATNSAGSDTANCTVTTVVPSAVINSFSTNSTLDSETNIVGILDVTMPSVATSPTIKVDVTRNGTAYTATATTLSSSAVTFSYSDGTSFTYTPESSSFTYVRDSEDTSDTSSDTYVFDLTITVNGQTTTSSLVAKTLAGRRVYSYTTAYPVHFVAGGTETNDTAWPKVILEFERIYRLLNENMNYYEGMFQDLVKRMEELQDYCDNLGANRKGVILMFYGSASDIPTGWHLCDGTNGTPDLRDKFIMGSGNKSIGSTGGSTSVTLSASNIPDHYHKFGYDYYDNNGFLWGANYKITAKHPLQNSGTVSGFSWNGHSHFNGYRVESEPNSSYSSVYVTSLPLTENMKTSSSASAITVTPPYYTLAFIMKIA